MLSNVLAQILTDHGNCKREGTHFLVPTDTDVTLYASVGDETLSIDRVKELILDTDVVVAISRDSRIVIAYEDVRVVRFSGGGRQPAGLRP